MQGEQSQESAMNQRLQEPVHVNITLHLSQRTGGNRGSRRSECWAPRPGAGNRDNQESGAKVRSGTQRNHGSGTVEK